MSLSVACPDCGKRFSVPAEAAGKKTTCTKCGTRFRLPDDSLPQRAAPPPAPARAEYEEDPDLVHAPPPPAKKLLIVAAALVGGLCVVVAVLVFALSRPSVTVQPTQQDRVQNDRFDTAAGVLPPTGGQPSSKPNAFFDPNNLDTTLAWLTAVQKRFEQALESRPPGNEIANEKILKQATADRLKDLQRVPSGQKIKWKLPVAKVTADEVLFDSQRQISSLETVRLAYSKSTGPFTLDSPLSLRVKRDISPAQAEALQSGQLVEITATFVSLEVMEGFALRIGLENLSLVR